MTAYEQDNLAEVEFHTDRVSSDLMQILKLKSLMMLKVLL